MDETARQEAVDLLVTAHRAGERLGGLPERCRPRDAAEALAIQDAALAALGETVAGYKVGAWSEGTLLRAAIFASRVFDSPASVPAARVPFLGVEPEIAFRFHADLPPRDDDYTPDEVAAACTAFPAIELVDSRFASYPEVPRLDQAADFMANGGFVAGSPIEDWRERDLVDLPVRVSAGEEVLAEGVGGHPRNDPFAPAVELANVLRLGPGVRAGQFMTTGSYCGLLKGRRAVPIVVSFGGIGTVEVRYD